MNGGELSGASRPVPVALGTQMLRGGGTERQMVELAKALDKTRFVPHVFCMIDDEATRRDLTERGIAVQVLPVRAFVGAATPGLALDFARYLRKHAIRIFHAFDMPFAIFGAPVARLARTPVVLTSCRGHRDLYEPGHQTLLRWSDRFAHGIVCNAKALVDDLVARGLPRERLHLCYNGIDLDRFPSVRSESTEGRSGNTAQDEPPASVTGGDAESPGRSFALSGNTAQDGPPASVTGSDAGSPGRSFALTIGTLCVLRPEKNLQLLLRAFAALRDRRGLKLRITGSGPEDAPLKALAQSLGLGPSDVRFHPSVTDVRAELFQIDIFVQPSLSEGLSNSIMEAMACGCTLAASAVGGNFELVKDRETGMLFDPARVDSLTAVLEELVGNADLRQRLASAGASFVRKTLSMSASASNMESIYEGYLKRLV